jgi:hypothetical protein
VQPESRRLNFTPDAVPLLSKFMRFPTGHPPLSLPDHHPEERIEVFIVRKSLQFTAKSENQIH